PLADAAWTRARNLDGLPHVRRFTRTGAKKLTRQGITALHFRGIRSSFPGMERKQYRLRGFLVLARFLHANPHSIPEQVGTGHRSETLSHARDRGTGGNRPLRRPAP